MLNGDAQFLPSLSYKVGGFLLEVSLTSQTVLSTCPQVPHLQARILEWVAFPFSRGSSSLRDRTKISGIAGGFLMS